MSVAAHMSRETSAYTAQVLAEKAAWELAKQAGLDLVVILPTQTWGPVISTAHSYSMTNMKVWPSSGRMTVVLTLPTCLFYDRLRCGMYENFDDDTANLPCAGHI